MITDRAGYPRRTGPRPEAASGRRSLLLAAVIHVAIAGCLVVVLALVECQGGRAPSAPPSRFDRLLPLHRPLGPPQPGDWLAAHAEPGQSFATYLEEDPVTARGRRRVIYVKPLGDFAGAQRKILELTREFLGLYFALPVRELAASGLDAVPASARRVHPSWGVPQILTGYVLEDVLLPALPDDAAAALALTTSDLWPGQGWNFVFGQASLRYRVGVWSIYRNGDPAKGPADFLLCLRRTLKTATHETGHMFSMRHCIAFECNMCGSNNREESDRQPLWLCPQCLAKLVWATGADPMDRFQRLEAFCAEHAMEAEAAFYARSIALLGQE
jgi:archaemetzincin